MAIGALNMVSRQISNMGRQMGGRRRSLAILTIAMLLAPALTLILTVTQVEIVAASPGWTTPSAVIDACSVDTGYAIDGDTGTCWHHDATCDHWIIFDLGTIQTVTKIRLYQVQQEEWGGIEGVSVYVSENTTDWGDAVWSGGMDCGAEEYAWIESGSFSKQGRYIKLVTLAGAFYERMYEFQAYIYVPPVYPTQPTLYLPADGSTLPALEDTPYFEWTEGENATSHRLIVDNDSNFSSPEENRSLTDNFYTIAGENALPDDNYSWKVGAINENGENWSAVWTFIVTNWKTPPSIENKCGEETGYEATKAIDENTSSAWRHNDTCYHEIVFDMENIYNIKKIRLYQTVADTYRWGRAAGLTVYVSIDNQTWGDNVWEGALNDSGWQENGNSFEKVGRYVRLVSKSDSNQQDLFEFQAYVLPTWQLVENWMGTVEAPIIWWLTETWTGTVNTSLPSTVTTENATNIGNENATFNATIEYVERDNVDIRFRYKSDRYCYSEGENANWSLENHYYYDIPTSPAEEEDWASRTPVREIAAFDSDNAGADYICDGENDENEIMAALENIGSTGGTLWFRAGHYYTNDRIKLGAAMDDPINPFEVQNVSLIGEGKDNTIIVREETEDVSIRVIFFYFNAANNEFAENILIENLTIASYGRHKKGEQNIIHSGGDSSRIVLKNLRIENCAAIGIYFESGPDNVWIENCEVKNTGDAGIVIANHDMDQSMENFYISGCVLTHNALGSPKYSPSDAIKLWSIRNIILANNVIENSGASGISIGSISGPAAKNILVQGNKIRNNSIDNALLPAIRIFGFSTDKRTDNIILRGNDINQFYGIGFNDNWVENCIFDNNNFYNTVIDFKSYLGTGHTKENNVEPYHDSDYYTSWETTSLENYSKNTDNLYGTDYYGQRAVGFRAEIRFDSNENFGSMKVFQSLSSAEPELISPENNVRTTDNTPTFEWYSYGAPGSSNLKVDNDNNFSSPEVNVTIYWAGGTSTYTVDELQHAIYYWMIIDDYGGGSYENSDVRTFTLAEWQLIETWDGSVEVPRTWELVETWSGTIEAPAAWQEIENWTGTIQTPSAWELVETWTGTIEAPVAWGIIETWTGTIEAFAQWELVETWDGTVQAIGAWELIETWTGTVEAFADWDLIETWTGTIEAFAQWNLIETWNGTIEAYAEWGLLETWTGTLQHKLASVTTESATSIGQTFATLNALVTYGSYENVDIRFQYRVDGTSTWENAAWENDYTAILYSDTVFGLTAGTTYEFRAQMEFGAFSDNGAVLEFTTQALAPDWNLIETWTGGIEVQVQWNLEETWTGTADTQVAWNLIETWTGTIESLPSWLSLESWAGTIEAYVAPEEEEPSPSGPGEEEPEDEEPTPTMILLGIGAMWVVFLAVLAIWVWAHRAGPEKRRWARDISKWIVPIAAILTFAVIHTENVLLTPIMKVIGTWIIIFVLVIFRLSSVEPGPQRVRWAKQFMCVLITLTFLTLLYLKII